MVFLRLTTLLLLATPLMGWAGPLNEDDFEKVHGLLDIPDGSYVEGSFRQGGVQPDYYVDQSHRDIQRLLAYARKVKKEGGTFWEKVERLQIYIKKRHLPHGEYEAPRYVDLNKKTLELGNNVSLGDYSACRSGVCRENALFLHMALKEAGIPNYHAYAKVRQASVEYDFDMRENHGFVVAEHEGKKWVLDSYNSNFNGFLLEDLMKEDGVTRWSQRAPMARYSPVTRHILEFLDYPKVWIPKTAGKPKALKLSKAELNANSSGCWSLFRKAFSGR